MKYEVYQMTDIDPRQSTEQNILTWLRDDIGKPSVTTGSKQRAEQVFGEMQHGILVELDGDEEEILKYK